MVTIAHALSPFKTCPFDCPFCCAKDNETNANITLAPNYWENINELLAYSKYQNLMLSGDTEPTLFPQWLEKLTKMSYEYDIITELRTHNYNYSPSDTYFNQVWYSITDIKDMSRLSSLVEKGKQFADEVNFAFLINKDFTPEDIMRARDILPIETKLTVRYLLDTCGSDVISLWVRENRFIFDVSSERRLEKYNIRIKRNYSAEYDIIRQDGKLYHEWQ